MKPTKEKTMTIVHSIAIRSTPERLYAALTTQEGIAGWWAPQAKAEPKVGSVVEVGFDPGQSLAFRVDQLEPARRVVWKGVTVPPEWQESEVTFELKPEDGAVTFTFTHAGLPPKYVDYAFFNFCWAQYVRSIKLLAETGTGEPFGSPAANSWHPLN